MGFPRPLTDSYAMLMIPSKGETALLSCHCLCDMAVCMHEVLARPLHGLVNVCPLL